MCLVGGGGTDAGISAGVGTSRSTVAGTATTALSRDSSLGVLSVTKASRFRGLKKIRHNKHLTQMVPYKFHTQYGESIYYMFLRIKGEMVGSTSSIKNNLYIQSQRNTFCQIIIRIRGRKRF